MVRPTLPATRLVRLAIVALAAAIASGASAQTTPDFSGRWTLEPPPAPAPPAGGGAPGPPPRGDMGSGWGSPITITQDARQLIVEYTSYSRYDLQPPQRLVYALDGSETRNTVMIGRGVQTLPSRTHWDGQRLSITTVFPIPGAIAGSGASGGQPGTMEVVQTLALETPAVLVVEATRGGVAGGKPSSTRTVYRKDQR